MVIHESPQFQTKNNLVFEEPYSISVMIKMKDGSKLVSPIFIGFDNYVKGEELSLGLWPDEITTLPLYPGITASINIQRTVKTKITKIKTLKRKHQLFITAKEL